MKTLGIEADSLNIGETSPDSLGPDRGAKPIYKLRPIRKRGYHRALKRNELWAIMQKHSIDLINQLTREMLWGKE